LDQPRATFVVREAARPELHLQRVQPLLQLVPPILQLRLALPELRFEAAMDVPLEVELLALPLERLVPVVVARDLLPLCEKHLRLLDALTQDSGVLLVLGLPLGQGIEGLTDAARLAGARI